LPFLPFQDLLKSLVTKPAANANELARVREDFISQWGAMGGAWGINRTMAQIHALLLVTEEPLSTDDVMARLEISRGNAHGNLRELVSWGLVRSVMIRGERREYFEAEKDIWTIFCIIARERKRREIDPAGTVLADCTRRAKAIPRPRRPCWPSACASFQNFYRSSRARWRRSPPPVRRACSTFW
jgi:DNA-binding transcriptional regulator GbsR (MarR family)